MFPRSPLMLSAGITMLTIKSKLPWLANQNERFYHWSDIHIFPRDILFIYSWTKSKSNILSNTLLELCYPLHVLFFMGNLPDTKLMEKL